MARESFLGEVKRLGIGSLIYVVPTFLTRGLSFILTPIYSRFLTPDDYGVVGLGTTVIPMVALLFGFGTQSAAHRLYHTLPDEKSRETLGRTVLGFLLTVPLVLALAFELLGTAGLLHPFKTVAYDPYLRLSLWAGTFALYPALAINMLMVREEHRRSSMNNALAVILTAGFTLLLVVVLRRGAFGQLLALFLSNLLVALWSIRVVWRYGAPRIDRSMLRTVLLFSLPLVPHELSKWALAASDRVVLERFVTTGDLGRYSIGYTFGTVAGVFLSAVSTAFFPIVSRKLAEKDPRGEVPFLGSVVVAASTFVCLGAAVSLPALLRLVTPAAYHGGSVFIPWIALGFFFQALYSVFSQGTFFARKTIAVAVVTGLGAAVNIGLNVIFVPRYGVLVAAITTPVGYAVMAFLHGWLASRVHPIAWEYGRMLKIASAALVTFALTLVGRAERPVIELALRSSAALVTFPILLVVFGALRPSELRAARGLWKARRSA